MWISSQVIFKDFNAFYVSFHMLKYGTYTFSFFVFALVKCVFCFSFSWIWKRADNKTNCFFKNYIWHSILNYSLLFRIILSLSYNQMPHETYIDYQTTQTRSRITVTSKMELFANIFDTFYFLIIVTKSSILDRERHFHLAWLVLINLKPIQSLNSNDKEDDWLLWNRIKLI